MTIIKTITLYQFAELPTEKAKEKARDWMRNCKGDDQWHEFTCNDSADIAQFMGLDIRQKRVNMKDGSHHYEPSVYFSGFSSQGDGACFDGIWHAMNVNVAKLKEYAPIDAELHRIGAEFETVARAYPEARFSVKHSGHYYHDGCTDFDIELGLDRESDEPDAVNEDSEAEKTLKRTARAFMRWIYRALEKEYEYQNSNEAIDEDLTANEYTFRANGTREDLEG